MTDISLRDIKCANCGRVSSQMQVYSVNYALGNKEENDKLVESMDEMMVCPYCGYKAVDISEKEDNMGIIDKIKYAINPNENVPQVVYGIPDSIRKKYEMEKEKNNPQRVYGVPNNKYEVNPEENIPQEVYGIPDALLEEPEENVDTLSINIRDNSSDLVFMMIDDKEFNTYKLVIFDSNKLNGESVLDKYVEIPEDYYQRFVSRFTDITSSWEKSYDGDSVVTWKVISNNKTVFSGNGGYPSNWNKFIELLGYFDSVYRNKKKIDEERFDPIKDMEESRPIPPLKTDKSASELLKLIENEVDQMMIERGLLKIVDGIKMPAFGSCHTRWAIEKAILKERWNVDWKTPDEEHPEINYD